MSPTKTESKGKVFRSSVQNLRLVIEPTRPRMAADGTVLTEPGKAIDFRRGVYETSDSEEIEFLRDHEEYQQLFHEEGEEPDRVDDQAEVLGLVVQALANKDDDALYDLYKKEIAAHSRQPVLDAIVKGLEAIDADASDDALPTPETPVHQLERVRDPSVVTQAGYATPEQLAGEVDNQGDPIGDDADGELTGDDLKARAAELEIEGRSGMTADELRKAIAKAEKK
jgi:hypothetical protein